MGNKKNKNKENKWLLKKKDKLNSHLLIMWSIVWILWIVILINSNFDWRINNRDVQEYNSASEKIVVWSFTSVTEKKDDVLSENAEKTIVDFYNNVNDSDLNWYFLLLDKILRSNDDIRTYFSQTRIDRFLKITDWGVIIKEIKEITNYSKKSDYFIKKGFNYSLEYNVDWVKYVEDWEMILMSYNKWEKFLINTLHCTTKDCAKLPFYN